MFYFLGKRTPEVLVLVSDPDGLTEVLENCLAWHKEMAAQLVESDPRIVQRAILEGLLYKSTGAEIVKRAAKSD